MLQGVWVTNHPVLPVLTIEVLRFSRVLSMQLLCVLCPSLVALFGIYWVSAVFVLYCARLWVEYSLDASNFPEEISCPSPFAVFVYYDVVR